jgi:DNA-directed RNA polymerase subunit RPC12/RpoP
MHASAVKPAIVAAPYADNAIPLFLTSLTGMRFRSLHCLECGAEFLERDGANMYRLNDPNLPTEIAISSESVKAQCGRCTQWYGVQISIDVVYESEGIPLYMQPQSIYLSPVEQKKLRYVHCLECGKTFHTISDRISQMVDNRIPFEYVSAAKLGPMEALCSYSRCGQSWALMV